MPAQEAALPGRWGARLEDFMSGGSTAGGTGSGPAVQAGTMRLKYFIEGRIDGEDPGFGGCIEYDSRNAEDAWRMAS